MCRQFINPKFPIRVVDRVMVFSFICDSLEIFVFYGH